MQNLYLTHGALPQGLFGATADYIASVQRTDGSIPWFTGGVTDPWDHTEAAMGLSIMGRHAEARRAYLWLAATQLEDGSWWAAYDGKRAVDRTRRETNFCAYVATGAWHHFLITKDVPFLVRLWPTIERAIEFVLARQSPHGEIAWACDADGNAADDALLTGSSSIYKSLECAILTSELLRHDRPEWRDARERLGEAIRCKPERFDRTWPSKRRYSMDWFYPVLGGAITGAAARARLRERWDEFVVADIGCHCVTDEPWITVAESCELVMALLAAGERHQATELFSWLHRWRDERGAYWTGYQMTLDIHWPDEQPVWTSAAVLLAADALADATPASHLFKSSALDGSVESAEQAEAENRA